MHVEDLNAKVLLHVCACRMGMNEVHALVCMSTGAPSLRGRVI